MDNNGQHIWSWVPNIAISPNMNVKQQEMKAYIIYILYGVGGVKIAYLGRPYHPFRIFKE